MKKYNIAFGVFSIALGAFAAVYALRYANVDRHLTVGAHTFPIIISIGLCLTGAVILVNALKNREIPGEEEPPEMRLSKVAVFAAAFVLYFILLQPLGFIVDGVLLTLFCMLRLGCRSWPRMIAYSVALPGAVFVAFYYFMYVDLPLGLLETVLPKY